MIFVSAFEKALLYYDTRLLPQGWDREELLGSDTEEGDDMDEVGMDTDRYPDKILQAKVPQHESEQSPTAQYLYLHI